MYFSLSFTINRLHTVLLAFVVIFECFISVYIIRYPSHYLSYLTNFKRIAPLLSLLQENNKVKHDFAAIKVRSSGDSIGEWIYPSRQECRC